MSKIFYEIINSDFKIAKKIIDEGFDINTQDSLGRSLLFYTKLNTSKYLIKKGIELDKKDRFGNTALMLNEDLEVIKYLIKSGANINNVNNNGRNALFYVKSKERIEYLITNGIDVNKKDIHSRNVLCYVNHDEDILLTLLNNNVSTDIEIKDNKEMLSLIEYIKKYRHVNIYKNIFRLHEEKVLKKMIENQNSEAAKKRI